jgi:5-methylcytosine-specific restriction endonuclease McrA
MTTATDRVLEVCELRPGPWPAAPRTCVWCAAPLEGRRRRWCSDECERTFTREHNWQAARSAAIHRDGGACVTCGVRPDELAATLRRVELLEELVDAIHGRNTWERRRARWTAARPWRDELRVELRLEVNHRTPILGRHAEFGCHHHVDGLETLCHRCHVAETARQFGHRTAQPAAQPSLF